MQVWPLEIAAPEPRLCRPSERGTTSRCLQERADRVRYRANSERSVTVRLWPIADHNLDKLPATRAASELRDPFSFRGFALPAVGGFFGCGHPPTWSASGNYKLLKCSTMSCANSCAASSPCSAAQVLQQQTQLDALPSSREIAVPATKVSRILSVDSAQALLKFGDLSLQAVELRSEG